MKRASGVLLHASSLWGKYSCGSFGKAAKDFIDFLSDCGFSYWQTLPFCLPDDFASPYSSYSAFSVNPDFIDLELLFMEGLLTKDELARAEQETPYVYEFNRLREERFELLLLASSRLSDRTPIEKFLRAHPHTAKFCQYMSLKEANGKKAFWEWTTDEGDPEVLAGWQFICWKFMEQWSDVRAYAAEKKISIVGDIPIYVSLDSSDVWENPDEFQLDRRRMPTMVAGVPPDYFCEDGQLWGNPLYDWDKMAQNGFAWWKDRISFMCEIFDCVRIDHFRGIESYYAIPADAETAREGKWKKGPGMKFVNAIKEVSGDKLLIAEDLGIITDRVRNLVKKSGFPGMRVLQFAFGAGTESPHLPMNYEENCVAYTGTHDNNTLLGYMWEISPETRSEAAAYCGFDEYNWDRRESYLAVLRTMLESRAGLVIFPLQDLLVYGGDTRMNTPGRREGNWAWRVTEEQLCSIDRSWWMKRNRVFGRI